MKYGKKIVMFTLFVMKLVDQPAPEVMIEQGIVSGTISKDGSVLEYIGIPYGTINSTNKFLDPLPPPKWEGVYKANQEYTCLQIMDPLGTIGTEDCLKVNIYVPAMAKKPLPVMVFIHGGAFILGSGGKLIYGPEFLVKHDVILVAFNYRLGILGFLCLGIKEAPGNAGIKDQIAALNWIKRNIAAFGGDPDNITIFGESAGGTSTSILLASEGTTGLFNKAIVQSGSSIANWAVNRNPVKIASLLTKTLGYETEDPYEIYNILSRLTPKELIEITVNKPKDLYYDSDLLHLPCVEKSFDGIEPAIPKLPFDLLQTNPKNISVIYGSTSKEGLFLITDIMDESLEKRNDWYIFASDLQFPSYDEANLLNDKLKKLYFGNERISMKTIFNVSDLLTHLFFEMPVLIETELLLNYTSSKVYNYYFDYSGGRNFLKYKSGFSDEAGACHGDELLYLFNGWIWPYRIGAKDLDMIDWMTKLWTNFAKYGDPTPSGTDLPEMWIPSKKNGLNFLYIGDELKMGPTPNPEVLQIYRDAYIKYRRKDLKYFQ